MDGNAVAKRSRGLEKSHSVAAERERNDEETVPENAIIRAATICNINVAEAERLRGWKRVIPWDPFMPIARSGTGFGWRTTTVIYKCYAKVK